MLSAAQLEFNRDKFIETNLKYNIFTQELVDYLGVEFFTAPATTTTTMYGCYPGGLLHNTIRACNYSIKLNELLPKSLKLEVGSIVKSVFLSQIGKVFLYCPNQNKWQRENLGKLYDFCNDEVKLRVGERSVYLALKYNVQLNETEYQAILNLDKENDDKQAKYFSETLSQIIKMGFDLAIMEEKNGKK
jgi:hypothetical protein